MHGLGNDFVIVDDRAGKLDLPADNVLALPIKQAVAARLTVGA